MLIAEYAQEVSSKCEDRRNSTHVDHSLTCCSEENSKVLGQQKVYFSQLDLLLATLRDSSVSLNTFKRRLKTYLFAA